MDGCLPAALLGEHHTLVIEARPPPSTVDTRPSFPPAPRKQGLPKGAFHIVPDLTTSVQLPAGGFR